MFDIELLVGGIDTTLLAECVLRTVEKRYGIKTYCHYPPVWLAVEHAQEKLRDAGVEISGDELGRLAMEELVSVIEITDTEQNLVFTEAAHSDMATKTMETYVSFAACRTGKILAEMPLREYKKEQWERHERLTPEKCCVCPPIGSGQYCGHLKHATPTEAKAFRKNCLEKADTNWNGRCPYQHDQE